MAKRKRSAKRKKEDEEYQEQVTNASQETAPKQAFAYANSDFEVSKNAIHNITTNSNVQQEQLAQFIPSMGKTEACIQMRMLDKHATHLFDNGMKLMLPEQACSLEVLKQRYEEAMAMEAQLEAIQQEIASTKSIVRAVMKKMNSRLAFANLGNDIICKIYEYCCSIPLDELKDEGMDAFSRQIRNNHNKNIAKGERRFDLQGNLNPTHFSLICKTFADALNHKPCALVIRKATLIPSAKYLTKIDTLPLLCTEPNRNLSKKLISIESNRTVTNGLFNPVHLILECKKGAESVRTLLSKYCPQHLTLSHLQFVPMLTALPDSVHTLSIIRKRNDYSATLVIKENLLTMLKSSPSVHTVMIDAHFVQRHFLEGVLKLDHVKNILCPKAATDVPFDELPELIEKYHSLSKTINIGVPTIWEGSYGQEKVFPQKYAGLERYCTDGIVFRNGCNVDQYNYNSEIEKIASYSDSSCEKKLADAKKAKLNRRKSVKNALAASIASKIDEPDEDAPAHMDQDEGEQQEKQIANEDDEDNEDTPAKKRQRRS